MSNEWREVKEITKEHEGWYAKSGYLRERKIIAVDESDKSFWGKFKKGMQGIYDSQDWLVRPPAPKKQKPSERINEICDEKLIGLSIGMKVIAQYLDEREAEK